MGNGFSWSLSIFLTSPTYAFGICIWLWTLRVSLRKEVRTEVKHAAVISLEHEDILWRNGVLGDLPRAFASSSVYTVGLHFSLRDCQETIFEMFRVL